MSAVWFFADVDGTLLRERYPVPEQVFLAAEAFKTAGGKIVLCTGRAPASTLMLARRLRVTMPGILCAGAMLYDFVRQQCLWSDPMTPDVRNVLNRVVERFPTIGLQAFTTKRVYVVHRNELMDQRGIREENVGRIYAPEEIIEPILKLTVCCEDSETLKRCGLEEFDPLVFNYGFSNGRFADVVRQGASKLVAAQQLFVQLGERPDLLLAAGDGMTDVPVLRVADYAYVPEAAPEDVLSYANMVIPSAENGGISQAFFDAIERMPADIRRKNP